MSKSKSSSTRSRLIRAGLATGAASTLLAALSAAPAYAVAGTLSLSSAGGPSGGGNTIVATLATAPTSPNPTSFTSSTAVYFVVAASTTATPTCPATYPSTAPSGTVVVTGTPDVKVLAPNKIAVTVPSGVTVSSSIFKYAVCAFQSNTSGANLIAGAQYTVGTKPTIAAVGGISPVSGPALGGTTITVSGSNFVANTTAAPNNTTATLDGQPLKDITVAGNGNSFTATTPPHAAGGPYLLAITTPAGTVNTLVGGTTKASLFSYTNGIVVSPNTAGNNRGNVDLDVNGVGFANLAFDATNGNTPDSANAHVYLTAGTYDEEGSTTKTNGEKTECINVLVIADNELLCTLPLNHTYDNAASNAITTATARTGLNITTTAGSTAITSTNGGTAADAGFTQADVGMPVSSAAGTTIIPAGTVITAVASRTSATMSVAAAGTAGTVTALADGAIAATRGGSGTYAAGTLGADKKTITAGTGFTKADIGRLFSSASSTFPANTTIVSVTADGTGATLSAAASGTAAAKTDLTVTNTVPVANGTYTVTVVSDGSVDAADTNTANYSQSIISSGSTFTVAEY